MKYPKYKIIVEPQPLSAALRRRVQSRWSVKTGADRDASRVDTTSATDITISELISRPVPSRLPSNRRSQPVETTVWALALDTTTLVAYKWEQDRDYHLVVSDADGNTMIVEIPDPDVVDTSSPFLPQITSAREAFTARFENQLQALQAQQALQMQSAGADQAAVPVPMITHVAVPVRVTGVGFFDFLHGQTGVAPNGIELHPVLSIEFGATQTGGGQ